MVSFNDAVSPNKQLRRHGVLALGCWVFGRTDWGGQSDDDSFQAMDVAWNAGITHWDTALAYGSGQSEILCGAYLRGKRDRAFLATKGMPGEHPDAITRSLEASLRNLGTERIDLYYLHWPKSGIDLRPAMERLEAARQRGAIGAIGVSNFAPAQMDLVREVGTVDVHQLCYSLLWRRREADVIPYCRNHGIAMVAYSPLAQGILAGRFARKPVFSAGDARSTTVFFESDVWPFVYDATEELKHVARMWNRPLTHLALQWILEQHHVDAVTVGARNAQQVKENVAAFDRALPPEALTAVGEISNRVRGHLQGEDNIFKYYP